MFADEIARAIEAAPRDRLAALSAALWKGYSAGAIPDDEAQRLAEIIEARKVVASQRWSAVASQRRSVGSRPRTSASLERRRSWAAGSWMPPALAAGFSQAENAALAVIIREIATAGRCGLPMGAVAARAGVGITSARNAVREARRRGILHVEERRVSRDRNLPNVVTIASRELALWVRTRSRVEGQGGGVKSVARTTNHINHSPVQPAPATWKKGQPMGWASSRAEGGRR